MSTITPPVRLILSGEFWDSQIYSGSLHLFGQSRELISHSWDRIVSELPIPEDLRVAANGALLGNHSLYEPGARQLVADPEIRPILIDKFHRLASVLDEWFASGTQDARVQDNVLPFPHNDSEIHYNRLYVAASQGLYGQSSGPARRRNKDIIRYSDAPALDIAAKFSTIAQACGSDGLLEIGVSGERGHPNTSTVTRLSTTPCASCEWAYSSVIASGYDNTVYLAAFTRVRPEREPPSSRRRIRKFEREVSGAEFFDEHVGQHAFTWGARDKIYRFVDNRIEVVRYSPPSGRDVEAAFENLGEIELSTTLSPGNVVSARVAPFGSVIEQDNGLLVIPSSGDPIWIAGEPVNWRVFPRSVDYVNHLHVVYEDRLEIWAFTHDYFTDQSEKLSGTEVLAADDG